MLQKNKIELTGLSDLYRKMTVDAKALAVQQTRLANSWARAGAGGTMQMFIPSANSMKTLSKELEIGNRQWAIQGQMISAASMQVQNWGKNMQWAGRQLMVGFTIPFAAAAAAAGVYAFQVDKQLTRIQKVYDGVQDGLRETAMNTSKAITKTLGTSTRDNLDVMAQLAAIGQKGADLQRGTAEVQRLTTLGEMDRLQSLNAVITLQSTFRMNTLQTADAINYMNAVENATSLSMQDFAEALPRAAAPVAELGGTIQELGTIMVAMKERGIDAGEGANAIKTLMNRLLNPAKETQLLFKQLTGKDLAEFVSMTEGKLMPTLAGLAQIIKNSNLTLVEQQQLIGQLGGSYQMTRLTSILQGLASEGGQVAKAMEIAQQSSSSLASTAAKELEAQTQSLSGQFKIALAEIQTELQSFGEMALKAATIVLKVGADVLGFINGLPGWLKTGLGVAFTGAAIAGPLVMMVGLVGNLIGTIGRGVGSIMGLQKKYRTMTIDQKAAELSAGTLNNKLVSQADATQILIFQLNKLQAAYQSTTAAATNLSNVTHTAAGGLMIGGMPVGKHKDGSLYINDPNKGPRAMSASEKSSLSEYMAIQAAANAQRDVTEETKKSTLMQKAFSQQALIGVSAVSGIASMATDTNSTLGKWLTGITIFTGVLGIAQPMLAKMAASIKNSAMVAKVGEMATSGGNVLTRAVGKVGGAIGAIGPKIFSPWGLAIAGITATIFGVFSLIKAKQNEVVETQRRLANSAEGWAKSLGFVKLEIGQIRDAAGGAQDTFNALVEKQKKENPDVVNAFKEGDPNLMYDRIRKEIYKLQSQGIGADQIETGIKAALTAAGKTKSDVEKIMSHIKVDLDFSQTKKTTDKFLDDLKNNLAELSKSKYSRFDDEGFVDIRDITRAKLAENARLFFEKLNTVDPAQQAYIVKQMQTQYNSIQDEFFNRIKNQYGGDKTKSGEQARAYKSYQEALSALTDFDPSKGFVAKAGQSSTFTNELLGVANSTREFAIELGKLYNISGPSLENIKNFADLMPYVKVNSMTATEASKGYSEALKNLESNGSKLTDQQKLQLAEIYASAGGLDAAKLAAGGYSDAQKSTARSIEETNRAIQSYLTQMQAATNATEIFNNTISSDGSTGWEFMGADAASKAQYMTNMQKEVFSGTMSTMYDVFSAQAEDQWSAQMDRIQAGFERRRKALENQSKTLDKTWDKKMQDFGDRWDDVLKSSKKSFDQRRKDIEAQTEAQADSIDAQIDKINEQKEAESELAEARQRAFDAEERRIQRLNELQNANIDYNRALAEGKLDEAARVQNNIMARQASWGIEDNRIGDEEAKRLKDKAQQAQIDILQNRKDMLQKEKQMRLDALSAEEEAVDESLRKQQESQQRALEDQREMEKERLQNRISSLSDEQQAVERTERRKQEMNRRTLEIELATLKAFVPQNETQLDAHIARVQGAYNAHGVQLTVKGGEWGQIVGSALQNNVDRARMQMSNDYAWQTAGAAMADAITKGAFGLSLGDFFNMIISGQPPAGWKPPGASSGVVSKIPTRGAWHKGGSTDMPYGSGRLGRTGGLYNDEFLAVLQQGEYVVGRDAVSKLGTGYLDAVNSGKTSGFGVGGAEMGFAGVMAGVAGTMMRTLLEAVFVGTQGQDASGFSGSVAGKPGLYGGVGLSAEQINNANIIASVGKSMGASGRDIVIALMTAMQESTLRNLRYGDRDSLGLFQQRPSQGWGSPAQILDPVYSSKKFFSSLFGVKNRNTMPLTMAAQAVQRSAFPNAYAKWQSMAEALVGLVGNGSFSSGLPGFGMFAAMLAGNSGLGYSGMPAVGTGKFMKPVNGITTSEFGPRRDPFTGKTSMHDGIDIGASSGTPIYATADGRVIAASFNSGGFGNWTLIDHGGIISGYAHQSRLGVQAGQTVSKGQVIGFVGSTGRSTGPHLHFQMGPGPGRFQNPRQWVPGLMDGGYIKYDNTLANLHKNETVLTAPLSAALERGINNIDNGVGDQYNIEVNFNGVTPDLSRDDIVSGVIEAIEKKQRIKNKRIGK